MIKRERISQLFHLTVFLTVVLVGFPVHCLANPSSQIDGHDPTRPFPYKEEEVFFVNLQAGVTLAGTLTLPQGKGPFLAVLIVGGAGHHQRDGYTGYPTHKLLVLSDYLTRCGIATLRYDKRGVGYSTGNYQTATARDFADDAGFGVEYLKGRREIAASKIGLIGHSEGGVIVPMVAVSSKDVSFIILMAGPGVDGEKILLRQREWIDRSKGLDDRSISIWQKMVRRICEEIKKSDDGTAVLTKLDDIERAELAPLIKTNPQVLQEARDYWKNITNQYMLFGPWGKFFLTYDPRISLQQVKCPVLVIGGEKDRLVFPEENLPAIESALKDGRDQDFLMKLFPNIGHGFQAYKPGPSDEPADPQQALAPEVLEYIGDWVEKHVQ